MSSNFNPPNYQREYAPGDLVVFIGNASPGRILERKLHPSTKAPVYSIIVRRGYERVVQHFISPDMIRPLTMQAIADMIGGPSSVTVKDVDANGYDYEVTVICHKPQAQSVEA